MSNPSNQPHPPTAAEARIDHVLNSLRTTEAPTGLEQRIAQQLTTRLAQTNEARTLDAAPFAATVGRATTCLSPQHPAARRPRLSPQ